MSPTARPLAALVRGYQRLAAGRASPCRFVPSCSSYAVEALEVHGAAKGSWLATRRLCRCHPWGGNGWDPVPPRKATKVPAQVDPLMVSSSQERSWQGRRPMDSTSEYEAEDAARGAPGRRRRNMIGLRGR